jgi:hypothetical protein
VGVRAEGKLCHYWRECKFSLSRDQFVNLNQCFKNAQPLILQFTFRIFFSSRGVLTQGLHLPLFVMGFLEIGLPELFAYLV